MLLYLVLFLAYFAFRLFGWARLMMRLKKDIAIVRTDIERAAGGVPGGVEGLDAEFDAALNALDASREAEHRLLDAGRCRFLVRRHDLVALKFNSMLGMAPQRWLARAMRLKSVEYLGDAPLAVSAR